MLIHLRRGRARLPSALPGAPAPPRAPNGPCHPAPPPRRPFSVPLRAHRPGRAAVLPDLAPRGPRLCFAGQAPRALERGSLVGGPRPLGDAPHWHPVFLAVWRGGGGLRERGQCPWIWWQRGPLTTPRRRPARPPSSWFSPPGPEGAGLGPVLHLPSSLRCRTAWEGSRTF